MKIIIYIFLSFSISALAVWSLLNYKNSESVLGSEIEISPTVIPTLIPTLTPSPTATPTPSPSPTPTLIPTPTSIPMPKYTSAEINGFIDRFAGQYGVDPNVLRHIAVCESGFNSQAVNGPNAGLYQFTKNSWITNRKLIGEDPNPDLRFDAEEAVQTTAYLLSLGKYYMWPNCRP